MAGQDKPLSEGVQLQTTEALRLVEERFRLLVEGIRDYAIFMLDSTGRVETWNLGAELIKGYKSEEIIGQHFSCFYPREAVESGWPERELEIAKASGRLEDEGWRVRKNGTRFWANVLITALYDEGGRLRGFSKVTRDITERRRYEEMLRSVVNNVIDGIITIDEQGTVQSFNPAAERLFGYEASEIIGQNVKVLMPQPYRGEHDGYVANYLNTGQAKIIGIGREVVGQRKDGSTFPMDLAVSEFTLGAQRFFTGIVRDITQRNRLEQQLRERLQELGEAEERTRSVVDHVIDGIITIDEYGRVETFNPAAEELFGYKSSEIIGQNVKILMPQPYQREHDTYVANYLTTGQAKIIGIGREVVGQRKDSSTFPMDLAVSEFHLKGRRYFTGIVRDISERKRLEQQLTEHLQELVEAEERTRSVVDHVIDGIITIDEYGKIETFNPAAEKLFGYKATDVIGQNVKMLMPQPYQNEHDSYLGNYLATGQAKIIGIGREVLGQRKDGSTFPMDLAVSEFHLKGRRYFTGIVRDISERKRNENELRDIAAKLSEANRRKTEFLATLAHELRNPLAPIRTGLEVIRMAIHDPATIEETRSTMERQTKQLITLVDDLLDISRITRGKLELRKCRVKLTEVVQSAVEASKPVVDEAGHELVIALPANPIYMEADPNRLAQVLANLLNNAAKYTPEGGSIWLAAERQGDYVVVSVKDTGIGIPADMRDRIFDMFTQIERPVEKTYTGLGIGLTLVKSLVELHGGAIEVYSEGTNQGSEFRIILPMLMEETTEEWKSFQPSDTRSRKCRVLVVDDNKAAADMLSMVVTMLGNEVRTASDGQEAVEVAAKFLPDLVLMDIGMPKMNGYEAARHIRKQLWGQAMILVALTGWGQDEDKKRTKEAGFDHHLVKPAEPSDLQRLLAAVKRDSD